MLCYYGDDIEKYRRWEDNIKMDITEIGIDVISKLRIVITRELLLTGYISHRVS